ncbi:hypothetical protein ACWD5Z_29430 [Micromonospora chokoriensis]
MTSTPLRTLVPVAVLAGLAACTTPSSEPEAGAGTTSPVPSATSASPDPSPTRTASATPDATRAACPASAATLQRVSGLGDSHRIDPDQINCARRWATAGVRAVDPSMQGDGVLVFEYDNGRWKKLGEGSAIECSPFGIPNEIGDQVGCRDH